MFYYNYTLEYGMPPPKEVALKGVIVPVGAVGVDEAQNLHRGGSARYSYKLRVYGVEFSLSASEDREDSAMLSTVYSTMSYCLHREEADKEELKKDSVREEWRLLRELPLGLSEDGSVRLNLLDGEEPLLLRVGPGTAREA